MHLVERRTVARSSPIAMTTTIIRWSVFPVPRMAGLREARSVDWEPQPRESTQALSTRTVESLHLPRLLHLCRLTRTPRGRGRIHGLASTYTSGVKAARC